MARKAAKTEPGPMIMVVLEQCFPENARIIDDELTYRILPFGVRVGLWVKLRLMSIDKMVRWTEKRMPGMWSGLPIMRKMPSTSTADVMR